MCVQLRDIRVYTITKVDVKYRRRERTEQTYLPLNKIPKHNTQSDQLNLPHPTHLPDYLMETFIPMISTPLITNITATRHRSAATISCSAFHSHDFQNVGVTLIGSHRMWKRCVRRKISTGSLVMYFVSLVLAVGT